MQQMTGLASSSCVRYRHASTVAAACLPTADLGSLVQRAALFVMICAFWGLVVFVALTTALR